MAVVFNRGCDLMTTSHCARRAYGARSVRGQGQVGRHGPALCEGRQVLPRADVRG